MRLTRVIHTSSQVFYGPLSELVPDVASIGGSASQVLLFADSDGGEAHGFVFSEDEAKQLARTILGLEVARVVPPAAGNGAR